MFIVYDDQPSLPSFKRFDFENANAVKQYLTHYSNHLLLQFIANHSQASFSERQQARKELEICDRKLDYWRRHPNYNSALANAGVIQMNKEWSQK
jgi:hypothetical protein